MHTLFLLPFAGGSKYSYQQYASVTSPNLRLVPIDIPGRGARMDEALLTDIHEISNDVFHQIKHSLDTDYSIYGHSMGTLLGYLVTRRIIEAEYRKPDHLFFTGSVGPSARQYTGEKMHLLSRAHFKERLRTLGGCPEELLTDQSLLDFFEPILRADFQAVENYKYEPAAPFHIPITVVTGMNEDMTDEEIFSWQMETTHEVHFTKMAGNHFFIFHHASEIMRMLKNQVISKTAII